LFGVCLADGAAQNASAMPAFPPIVSSAYALKPDGTLAKAVQSCGFCHVASGPPKRNPYGADLKTALEQAHTRVLSAAILHSIDAKDSDGDGFTNAAEIAADTLPGDPASRPAGQPAAAPAPTANQTSDANSDANPFALKTVLLPKHAQHPVLVHFPIALLVISLLFDLLGYVKKNPALTTAAYYNLIAAGIVAPFAVITGVLAWIFAYGQAPLQGYLLYHLLLGVLTMLLILALLWLRAQHRGRLDGTWGRTYTILGIIAFLIITLTGHLGGFLAQGG